MNKFSLSLSLSLSLSVSKTVENSKDITSVWRALNTFTEGTHSSQKEIPHHFTADAFNDYFLSFAETLVKSQDSPDSNKKYSCSKCHVDFCQQKTKGTFDVCPWNGKIYLWDEQ